ncbi:hypothetical protein SOP93_22055 [Peribacillus frigoritolerans]|uniref:hypothetical protein n=1 Tax=Peribacillus frigoritolerans TaxID=450367 RepID=UPI002B24AEB2|nr:hypothetical protein [Peribacillus frigoritolerans]MEB2493819.1 hypothetical protein [Peribacillus frigoritolerans]
MKVEVAETQLNFPDMPSQYSKGTYPFNAGGRFEWVPSGFLKKLIGAGFRDSCGKGASKGVPTGTKAPRADRPRKARAWSGNERSKFTTSNPS